MRAIMCITFGAVVFPFLRETCSLSLHQLRTEVNKVLESARTGKLIGSSLDAKVWIHTSDGDVASRLQQLCGASNDADRLHKIFITSQASSN